MNFIIIICWRLWDRIYALSIVFLKSLVVIYIYICIYLDFRSARGREHMLFVFILKKLMLSVIFLDWFNACGREYTSLLF